MSRHGGARHSERLVPLSLLSDEALAKGEVEGAYS
jgi:hypothetical protein